MEIKIFGKSHDPYIGVEIKGFPKDFKISFDELDLFMARRKPQSDISTSRCELDRIKFTSGLENGITNGTLIRAIIENNDTKADDYKNLKYIPRPSHADYTSFVKYGKIFPGGGSFSGRMTAPLCVSGGLCIQYLKTHDVYFSSHIYKIGSVFDTPFDFIKPQSLQKGFPVINYSQGEKMKNLIKETRDKADSIGGIVECAICGMKPGIGAPLFDSLEGEISKNIFAIPAVRGIEFGNGFAAAELYGSQNNDSFYIDNGMVKTATNNSGGIQGGISNGMPLIFRVAFKPTPSISREQDTVDLKTLQNTKLTIVGRHDPCIVPRAVVCCEAAAAIAICSAEICFNDKDL